jgi:hypothetical protein
MLSLQPNRGDVVKLPQGVIAYQLRDKDKTEMSLLFFEEIKKPSVAIFVEKFNDSVSKLIYGDKIIYVYDRWIYNLEEKDADQVSYS